MIARDLDGRKNRLIQISIHSGLAAEGGLKYIRL